jgi:hypothetical protein
MIIENSEISYLRDKQYQRGATTTLSKEAVRLKATFIYQVKLKTGELRESVEVPVGPKRFVSPAIESAYACRHGF